MDKTVFIKELKTLFANLAKTDKKYSNVWLSEIDFGGLYFSDKYILNVKMENHIDSITTEIVELSSFLREKLGENILYFIESLTVYNTEDSIWHQQEDIILYDDAYVYVT